MKNDMERPAETAGALYFNVIQFADRASALKERKEEPRRVPAEGFLAKYHAEEAAERAVRVKEVLESPESFSVTCRNMRLRADRRAAYWKARRETDFARAQIEWHHALCCAHEHSVPGSDRFPKPDWENLDLVTAWRRALVRQILTPAPDLAAVSWKRAQLKMDTPCLSEAEIAKLHRLVDADAEWLASHPTKRKAGQ